MKRFFSFFKSQAPEIIQRLKAIRVELDDAQKNIERLIALEQKITFRVDSAGHGTVIGDAFDNFGVAMWVKDLRSKFLFANKACCDTILKCSEEEALNFSNGDFERDILSKICMTSDRKTEKRETTLRFIEHGVYAHGHVFLDVVKSPTYDSNKVITGTMGSAVEITHNIPDVIKKCHLNPSSIEIPLESILCKNKLIEFLERRGSVRDVGSDV